MYFKIKREFYLLTKIINFYNEIFKDLSIIFSVLIKKRGV